MATKAKTKKPLFRTDSPFPKTEVHQLEQPHHDAVVDLLVNVLKPLGAYNAQLPKSKGKHTRKRKRASEKAETDASHSSSAPSEGPAKPPVSTQVLIGFNNVNRHLEALSAKSGKSLGISTAGTEGGLKNDLDHIAAVFLLRPLDDLIYSHLPTICHTASLAYPELPATRLLLLDPAAEKRVAEALHQANSVSLLAIKNEIRAPGVDALLEYVRQYVEAPDVKWLEESVEAKWLGTKIDAQ